MIPYDSIHKMMSDTRWASLADRGISRPIDDIENKCRLRESRMNIEDIVAEAVSKPEKVSMQAMQMPEVVANRTRVTSETKSTPQSTAGGSSPANDSTFLKDALDSTSTEITNG